MTLEATKNAVAFAMSDLEKTIKDEGKIRTATDGIFQRMTVTTTTGTGFVVGALTADYYWRWVGNGRRPGDMPPVQSIQEWINRTGFLTLSAWAVAKTIAKRGSKAFREKKKNVFLSAADKWEKGEAVSRAMSTGAEEVGDWAFEIVKRNLKP
jgi:hypothetical protein